MSDDEDNVFRLVPGGNGQGPKSEEEKLPTAHYTIEDIEGEFFSEVGFCIFTTSHVAIMKETPQGATPVLIVPLHRVKAAYIDDEQPNLPF